MINILTNDVHTYAREVISKEFGSGNKEEKAHSDNRKLINSRMRQAISSISDGDKDNAHRSSLPDGISNRLAETARSASKRMADTRNRWRKARLRKSSIRLFHLNFSQTEIQREEYHEIKQTRQR